MGLSIFRRLPLVVKKQFGRCFPPPPCSGYPAVDAWLILAPGVQADPNEDGLVLFSLDTGRIYVCHRTASWIWLSARDGLSREATADLLATRFDVSRETALHDIDAFVTTLRQLGLAQGGRP